MATLTPPTPTVAYCEFSLESPAPSNISVE
jgi:hypothetical protein